MNGARSGACARGQCRYWPHYCDALGIRAFAGGKDLEADLGETSFKDMVGLVDKPLINMESAVNHPCQALADWKTLDDLSVPRTREVRAVVGEPSARAAARRARRHRAHGRACAAWKWWCCGPKASRCPPPIMQKARPRPRPPPAARCARPPTATTRSPARTCCTPRNGARPSHYGNAEADARLRARARRLVRARHLVLARRGRLQTHALPAGAA